MHKCTKYKLTRGFDAILFLNLGPAGLLPIHTALMAESGRGRRKPYPTSWSELVSILLIISTNPHGGKNKNYPFSEEGRRRHVGLQS